MILKVVELDYLKECVWVVLSDELSVNVLEIVLDFLLDKV